MILRSILKSSLLDIWLGIHNNRFANAAEQVAAIKYVLSGTALQWFNDIAAANMPATITNLQRDLFAKFRIAKTRVEWKKELEKCKYIPRTSTLPMFNKFQLYCGKLQWSLPVQIKMFVHILPMQLCQFVVSRAHATFAEVKESVKTFQELVVSVGEDSYQYRSKMNWSDPEVDQHEPKPWAQAEKCKYSIDKTNTYI